ncbi:MAG TPA: hypothetical protein VHU83_13275 [Bryobacteraceae bacterium]|nr:hypothetical protein [Bryobacteraceae bacterium]
MHGTGKPNSVAEPPPASSGPANFRAGALKALLQNASDNYRENSKTTLALDDKAHKTITTAGIFLAASFAFIKPENAQTVAVNLTLSFLLLLLATITMFMLCVGACVWGMRLAPMPLPIPFKIFQQLTNDVLRSDGPDLEEAFSTEQIYLWEQTLALQVATNIKKARSLRLAQYSLGFGMLLVAVILINTVVVELNTVPKL